MCLQSDAATRRRIPIPVSASSHPQHTAPISALRLGISILILASAPWAQAPFKAVKLNTGHGLEFGRGRKIDNGLHAGDSLSLSLRQRPGAGRLTESASLEANTNLQKQTLQSGEADLDLHYRLAGFSVGGGAGLSYASVVFDKLSRTEKVNSGASTDLLMSADATQRIALDADSAWEWRIRCGYDAVGTSFKTLSASTGLRRTLGEFEIAAQASGYGQQQTGSVSTCAGKGGKNCADSTETATVHGMGVSLVGEWDNGNHLVSAQAGMDWLWAATPQRILTVGLGYAYSPWSWLDIGAFVLREKDFDAAANAKFWEAGTGISFSL